MITKIRSYDDEHLDFLCDLNKNLHCHMINFLYNKMIEKYRYAEMEKFIEQYGIADIALNIGEKMVIIECETDTTKNFRNVFYKICQLLQEKQNSKIKLIIAITKERFINSNKESIKEFFVLCEKYPEFEFELWSLPYGDFMKVERKIVVEEDIWNKARSKLIIEGKGKKTISKLVEELLKDWSD